MTDPTILTKHQQHFLRRLAKEDDIASQFILSGGTALSAYYLHHRLSDDLDFFSQEKVDALRIRRFLEEIKDDVQVVQITSQKLYDRHIFLLELPKKEELKVEFTHYPFPRIEVPKKIDGIFIDSLRDIAAGKLFAMLDRFEPKDFYDLYFLLRDGHSTIKALRDDIRTKFNEHVDPLILGTQLARGGKLPVLPHTITDVPSQEVQNYFVSLAKSLRGEVMEE